ncbi:MULTISPECIES: hypothetical protein [unclassified Pseudomonas]|uniref:hypothetical protein n=1 Tax=unclassified Pseudomonas TaxID=196821 RepID=UPI000A1F6DC1|nr:MULTISPECIES: hypothetical protein [unclassified Pseudomonas]
MNRIATPQTFFIVQVENAQGVFGFQICLTDQAFARHVYEVLGRDLPGRRVILHSLEKPPETVKDVAVFRSMTQRMKLLMERCQVQDSPGRAFLIAYVEHWHEQMPTSVIEAFFEHATYEPDHEQFVYIQCAGRQLGAAYERP